MPITPGTIDFAILQGLIGNKPATIIEIGANDGTDTNRLLENFPLATVHAFEPDPRAVAKFRRKVTNTRAHLHEYAIGATNGNATFHISSGLPTEDPTVDIPAMTTVFPEGWDQSSSLRNPKKHLEVYPWVKFEREITVPVMTLDTFVQQAGLAQIDLIWADTQGAEGDLITGGKLALANTRYLYTEYSNDEWYEGQITLDQMLAQLPHFRLLQQFETDALLGNHTLQPSGLLASLGKRMKKLLFS